MTKKNQTKNKYDRQQKMTTTFRYRLKQKEGNGNHVCVHFNLLTRDNGVTAQRT